MIREATTQLIIADNNKEKIEVFTYLDKSLIIEKE